MSFFLRQSIRAARPVSIATPVRRTFASSSVRGLKESDRHNPEQAAENEHHKQDQLAKQKEGKNHWKPELASDSEEAKITWKPISPSLLADPITPPGSHTNLKMERKSTTPGLFYNSVPTPPASVLAEEEKIAPLRFHLVGNIVKRVRIAADRHEHSDLSKEGIKELQKKTEGHAEEKLKNGTSKNTGL
ncbi:hypothetical protein SBOR_2904 [Sclerotinia borealis F-4128]|uniref:Uncharacterized protein n=1 Tax=Sclerotinia borealis (strain F-4128) TaxID=1432307 RepID=W9CLI1_SCLBF|nr:hypothetical protein SBOR_2904 [Sclerotinia borealis F-4128]